MRTKFLGFLSAAVLILGAGAGSAYAESFSLGGSFDGFGGWSHSDKNGPPVGRSQAFLNELPTVCSASNAGPNCLVNFANVTPGDTDFGIYETSLSLVGSGEINEYADMVFRLGVYAPGSGDDTAAAAGPGEVSLLVEQAYADFHTDDGELGMSIGRLAPNVGTSLHSADRGSPFLSIARSKLLPTLLTGGMAYYKSGEVTASVMLYNDLAGTNNQTDLDLGYAVALAYTTDEMSARLSWFASPEAFDAARPGLPGPIAALALADPDNKNWVNVVNINTTMTMDEMSAYLDLTWRRDGFAGSKDPQAIAIGLGGELDMTDMLFGGLSLEWVHGNNDAGFIPVGLLSGTAGINNEDTVVLNPYVGVHLAERTGLTLGYNLEHRSIDIPGDNNRNFHTVYVMATAVFDSGSEPRSPTLHPLN